MPTTTTRATSSRGCGRSMTAVMLVLLIALLGRPSPAAAQLGDAHKCRDTCLEGCTGWVVVCHVSCASACSGAGGIGIMSIDNGIPPDHPNPDDLPKPPPLPDLVHPLRGAGGIAFSPAPSPAASESSSSSTSDDD
ncbi:uncharacterized protein [Aegilops tauschii subsp. strangulata]|nr:uncharacterized protein LOC109733639 [Aegilops tauschii subsp. strangulata]